MGKIKAVVGRVVHSRAGDWVDEHWVDVFMCLATAYFVVDAYRSRDDNWTWLFPAGCAFGFAVTWAMRLEVVARRAHDVRLFLGAIIGGGLVLVSVVGSDPVLAVRFAFGLIGPATAVYAAETLMRFRREAEAKDELLDELKHRNATLSALTHLVRVQSAQSELDVRMERHRVRASRQALGGIRIPRVAGRRRVRG